MQTISQIFRAILLTLGILFGCAVLWAAATFGAAIFWTCVIGVIAYVCVRDFDEEKNSS